MSASTRKRPMLRPVFADPFLLFFSGQTLDHSFLIGEISAVGRWFDEFGEIGVTLQISNVVHRLPADFDETYMVWAEARRTVFAEGGNP